MSSLSRIAGAIAICAAASLPTPAWACSSCGCTLNSDWTSQGYASGGGFYLDLRTDYFNQDQLRAGTGTVDRGAITLPSEREIQGKTVNRNYTLTADYSRYGDWGVTVQVPYYDRYHTTIAEDDTETSTSHSRGLGDVRLLGRYQGFVGDHRTGVQFGLKLPSGAVHDEFRDGPQKGNPVDRGLQLGTGTTDLLVGVYHFGTLHRDWDYFAQALVQRPLNSSEDFRPGTGLNMNLGTRYTGNRRVVPHLQLNLRLEDREAGTNADVANSGATLLYVSPGITVNAGKGLKPYAFVQLPVYQRVNGYQIEPHYLLSIGLHYTM